MAYSTQQGLQNENANTVLAGPTSGSAANPAYRAVVETDLSLSNVSTNDVSTSKHGFTPILPNDATKFLDGTGHYTTPSGAFGGVNSQTISYLAVAGDSGKLVAMNGTSVTLTLPAAPPSSTWFIAVENLNGTSLTISPNGLNIDGSAGSLTLTQDQGVLIFTDGVNYFTERGMATGGGGGGTVTSVAMTGDGTVFNSSVTGSPITSSGTLAPSLATQSANNFLAGPASGSAAAPTFRSIASADLPAVFAVTAQYQVLFSATGNTTSLTGYGDSITIASGATGSATATSTEGPTIQAGGGANTNLGFSGNLNYLGSRNIACMRLGSAGAITTSRFWIGFTDQTLATMCGSANPAGNYAAFRYDTSVPDTHWQCVTKDGTTQTITATTVVPTANATQKFSIIYDNVNSQVLFFIGGVLVGKNTTHLPPNTTIMRWCDSGFDTGAGNSVHLEQFQIYMDF